MGDYIIEGDLINQYSTLVGITLNNSNPQQSGIEINFVCENPNGYKKLSNKNLTFSEIYPNPVIDIFHIDITSNKKNTFTLSISSIIGKVFWVNSFTFLEGKHTISVPTTTLPKGSYILNIINIETNKTKHLKFIK